MIDESQIAENQNQRTIQPQQPATDELQQEMSLQQAEMQPLHVGVKLCPYCGAENEADAVFCAQCGQPIEVVTCPYCGAKMDPDADFCEACHHYVKKNICSYCGNSLHGNEAYCPECGSPRGGLVCPTCHTLNDFAFCKKCGTPLTAEAQDMVKQLQNVPEYRELQAIVQEYNKLDSILPCGTEKERLRERKNEELRVRVLSLLAKDAGKEPQAFLAPHQRRMTKEELEARKEENVKALAAALERLETKPMESPVVARNFAMACKPQGIRLAWVCNYKHAMHSSPCGCAKPQLGGKWVVLGRNNKSEIKDDKK